MKLQQTHSVISAASQCTHYIGNIYCLSEARTTTYTRHPSALMKQATHETFGSRRQGSTTSTQRSKEEKNWQLVPFPTHRLLSSKNPYRQEESRADDDSLLDPVTITYGNKFTKHLSILDISNFSLTVVLLDLSQTFHPLRSWDLLLAICQLHWKKRLRLICCWHLRLEAVISPLCRLDQ